MEEGRGGPGSCQPDPGTGGDGVGVDGGSHTRQGTEAAGEPGQPRQHRSEQKPRGRDRRLGKWAAGALTLSLHPMLLYSPALSLTGGGLPRPPRRQHRQVWGWASGIREWTGPFPPRPPSSARRRPPSCCVLAWWPSATVCVLIPSSYKDGRSRAT